MYILTSYINTGGWPAIFKTVPATAITFAVYEACKATMLAMRANELLRA